MASRVRARGWWWNCRWGLMAEFNIHGSCVALGAAGFIPKSTPRHEIVREEGALTLSTEALTLRIGLAPLALTLSGIDSRCG